MFPKGKGYISIDNVEKAGELPSFVRDMSTDGSGRFAIAAFHQLHCLVSTITPLKSSTDLCSS